MLGFLPIGLFLPFAVAACVPALSRALGRRVGWAVATVSLTQFVYFISLLNQLGVQGIQRSWPWVPALGIQLTLGLDGLSLLFSLLITGIGLLVVVYSIYYLDENDDWSKFYVYLLLFMGAMLGVVLSENLVSLYVFWELTSISSFLLIGFWHVRSESREGAIKSIVITIFGGLSLLAGFSLLYVAGGTLEFRELVSVREEIIASPLYIPAILLIMIGAFTKSAQVPFHIWLPSAMAAPTPISAYLHSATMVKAGIYLIAKFSLALGGTQPWYYVIAGAGALTVAFAAFWAIRQIDLKALLAFSTVSQLGLILPMFAIGTDVASLAGVSHMLHHATFKGALFMLVGIIDKQMGTRDLYRLSGLKRRMPITSLLLVIAALSMAGVWPLNGFVSKELIFEALLQPPFGSNALTWLFAALAVAGSVFTTVYSLLLAHRLVFGAPQSAGPEPEREGAEGRDPGWPLLVGPVVLVGLVVLLGVYPYPLESVLYAAGAAAVIGHLPQAQLHTLPVIGMPLLMSVIALGVGLLLYTRIDRIRAGTLNVPALLSSNAMFHRYLHGLPRWSDWLTRKQMTGFLRDYLLFIIGATVLVVGYGTVKALMGGIRLDLAPVSPWETMFIAVIVIGSLMVVRFHQRLNSILALGTVGAVLSILFVLFHAPDLALTQLLVEIISTVLLLLVFRQLPPTRKEKVPQTQRAINLAVAIGSGAVVAAFSLAALGSATFAGIGEFFTANSIALGGGTNVVNVILVDFRGFDTMGEITVLAIAALAVRALVRLRSFDAGRASKATEAVAAHSNEGVSTD